MVYAVANPSQVRRPDGDRLMFGDGRWINDAEATYLPPCDPTKILCIHLNYNSRRIEFKAPDRSVRAVQFSKKHGPVPHMKSTSPSM